MLFNLIIILGDNLEWWPFYWNINHFINDRPHLFGRLKVSLPPQSLWSLINFAHLSIKALVRKVASSSTDTGARLVRLLIFGEPYARPPSIKDKLCLSYGKPKRRAFIHQSRWFGRGCQKWEGCFHYTNAALAEMAPKAAVTLITYALKSGNTNKYWVSAHRS